MSCLSPANVVGFATHERMEHMSEQDVTRRVVEVCYEMSEAGSTRMKELVDRDLDDDHIVEHILDNSDLISSVLDRVSSEDMIEQLNCNGDLEDIIGTMDIYDVINRITYLYGVNDILEHIDSEDILNNLDTDDVEVWVSQNVAYEDVLRMVPEPDIVDYVIEHSLLAFSVSQISERYHTQRDSIIQMRDNMSSQTYDFNQAQAKIGDMNRSIDQQKDRISDLVRHNEEQARLIALADASLDPMVPVTPIDDDFEALLDEEQHIADGLMPKTPLDESIEALAVAILGDNPSIVGNDPR